MTDPCFVDTNLLVYRHDSSDAGKQARADAWYAMLWERRLGHLSYQVLQELYATLTRGRQVDLNPREARDVVEDLLRWRPVGIDTGLLRRAWVIEERFRLSWWDALIVAAAQVSACPVLLTEDLQAGQLFDGVRVVDPFAAPDRSPLDVLERLGSPRRQ